MYNAGLYYTKTTATASAVLFLKGVCSVKNLTIFFLRGLWKQHSCREKKFKTEFTRNVHFYLWVYNDEFSEVGTSQVESRVLNKAAFILKQMKSTTNIK